VGQAHDAEAGDAEADLRGWVNCRLAHSK
jgi:hypothetical protein